MNGIVGGIIELAVRALALALVGGLCALALRKAPAAVRHAVWSAVLLGMLALPALFLLAPRWNWTVPYWKVQVPAVDLALSPADAGAPGHRSPARPLPPRIDWKQAAGWAYFAGVTLLLARLGVGRFRLGRLLRDSRAERMEELGEVVVALGVWRIPEVRVSERVRAPFVAGWRRPLLVLPTDWRTWSRMKLRSVLAHELTHLQRLDWLTGRLAAVNRCVYWFHPVAWWMERHLAALAEEVADEAALAVVGDAKEYAGVIVDFAFAIQGFELGSMESTAMARSTKVGRRVERILAAREWKLNALRRGTVLAILALALPLVYAAASFCRRSPNNRWSRVSLGAWSVE
jgi:beta-lactamase regulating signal transducer with metallopeptidase domain